jgi:hypothetical protein
MNKTNWINLRALTVIIAILMALSIGLGVRVFEGSEDIRVDPGQQTVVEVKSPVIVVQATVTATPRDLSPTVCE